jgi:hypothetical protein
VSHVLDDLNHVLDDQHDDLYLWVGMLQDVLRLQDWRITIEKKPELTDNKAYVVTELQKREATIFYNPTEERLSYYIAHEMGHILLSHMAYLACDGRAVELMESYAFLEERVCDIIADLVYDPAPQLP